MERSNDELRSLLSRQNEDICQTLGKALGYPWFKDDPVNFPEATISHGVCVGDHVAESLAMEASRELFRLRRQEGELLEANNRYLMAGRAARQTIGLAHARLSHVLLAMLKAREVKVLLDPIWFTEKVSDVAQTLAAGKPDEEQFIGAGSCQMCHENAAELCRFCKPLIKVEVRQSLPNPAGVMSGRDGDSLWEVRAYYSSREEADAAHEIIARPEMNRRAEG